MNSSLRKESLFPRIDGIQKNVFHLQEFSALSFEKFGKEEILDRVHHHLRLALEGVFHITAHILSRFPGARETEYKRMAQKLGTIGIVDPVFAENILIPMAGYRNRLTHFYSSIKAEELYELCKTRLPDILSFLQYIQEFLKHPEKFHITLE